MPPRDLLDRLYGRYPVTLVFGERFLPLLERAEHASPEIRARIHELVAHSFERESKRSSPLEGVSDHALIQLVAAILVDWSPPAWLVGWSEKRTGGELPPGRAGS